LPTLPVESLGKAGGCTPPGRYSSSDRRIALAVIIAAPGRSPLDGLLILAVEMIISSWFRMVKMDQTVVHFEILRVEPGGGSQRLREWAARLPPRTFWAACVAEGGGLFGHISPRRLSFRAICGQFGGGQSVNAGIVASSAVRLRSPLSTLLGDADRGISQRRLTARLSEALGGVP
jgi:hypothetical protein